MEINSWNSLSFSSQRELRNTETNQIVILNVVVSFSKLGYVTWCTLTIAKQSVGLSKYFPANKHNTQMSLYVRLPLSIMISMIHMRRVDGSHVYIGSHTYTHIHSHANTHTRTRSRMN